MGGARHNGQFHNILVAYDGSVESEKALNLALALAGISDAKILLLTVAQPPEPSSLEAEELVMDDVRNHFAQRLCRIADSANENGISIEPAILVGHPAEQIVKRAEDSGADLIVIGRRGTSVFETLLGSVSERVLWHAPCHVLVAR
jgi:nucleotide-binding universal stress UspA family protein